MTLPVLFICIVLGIVAYEIDRGIAKRLRR